MSQFFFSFFEFLINSVCTYVSFFFGSFVYTKPKILRHFRRQNISVDGFEKYICKKSACIL